MFSALRINRFRGITECRIDNLKTINVFVGRNNQGKSSILEALYLASAAFSYTDPWQRGYDKMTYLLNRRSKRGLGWGSGKETLWHKYNMKKPIEIQIYMKSQKFKIRLFDWHNHPLTLIPITKYTLTKIFSHLNLDRLHAREWNQYCYIESAFYRQKQKSRIDTRSPALKGILRLCSKIEPFMEKMMFIDSNLLHEMESVEKTLWNDLLRERHDRLVTNVLRKGYDVDVEDLTYMPYGSTYQLAVKLPKTTIRVDDLGDGARYSMIWIMVAALAKSTAILIEEPENHQHPGGLAKSIEMLLEIIKKNDSQLFVTTHSLEFLKLLEKIAGEMKIDMNTFFIEMNKAGKIEPRSITPKDSDYLTKMGLDVRFLDMI